MPVSGRHAAALDALAQRIDTKATWDDIVLPTANADLLRQIADQVATAHQGLRDLGLRAAR